jgi:hypothetical protein
MPRTDLILDYASPLALRARRRKKLRRVLACYLGLLPVALLVGLISGWFESGPAPMLPGTQYASASIRRGNAVADFDVEAQGFIVGGRPVFHQVHVMFYKPSGRGLQIDLARLTYHPFANSMSSADYRPVTPAAMLAHYASIGCNSSDPRTVEMANALEGDLRLLSTGSAPNGKLWTGLYVPPPPDYLITPLPVIVTWFIAASALAVITTL